MSSSKRALANQNSQAHSQRLSRMARSALVLCATLLSFAAFALLAADQLYRPDTFVIDQLKIKGSFHYLQPQQIEDAVNQQAVGNFFSIELQEIKGRVEQLQWVQSAEVRREWPHTLLIDVQEQYPVMRWQSDRWVNSNGEVIDLPESVGLANPITLSGREQSSKKMMRFALEWRQRLAHYGLQLIGVSLSESQAYALQLRYPDSQYSFELLLGREQTDQRLERFIMLFEHQYQASRERLTRVDARYPDGLAVKSIVPEADSLALNQATASLSGKLR